MADEKDKKEKKAPAKKAAAKKDAKAPKAKAAADSPKKESAKKAKAAPKAEKKGAAKVERADGDSKPAKGAKKPRRRSRAKAAAKEAPTRRRRSASDELPVVHARARYVRIAPRKVRLVADQVRGLHIEKARALLQFSPRGAALDIRKLIDSAAANAEENHDLVGDEMRISSITVDEGPTLRRFRPRALGRATPINKRTSHIAVALTPVEED